MQTYFAFPVLRFRGKTNHFRSQRRKPLLRHRCRWIGARGPKSFPRFVVFLPRMNLRRQTRAPKGKLLKRSSLVKEVAERRFRNGSYDANVLKRVLTNLSKLRKRRRDERSTKAYCQSERLKEKKVDDEVRLRCRQLPSVVRELRKAVMRQDWHEVATLLLVLCHPGLKHYDSIIVKVCFILLFTHPNSSLPLLQNFIRHATEYILDEDINKFIRILFALRKTALMPLTCGKYIRRTGDYKVTRDPQFEAL